MMLRYEADLLGRVCSLWGLHFLRPRSDLPLAGSPERCEFRTVVEDRDQHLYILESISPDIRRHKQKIASCLEYLAGQNLSLIHPYLKHTENETIAQYQGGFWQLGPYVPGVELRRPDSILHSPSRSLLSSMVSCRD